MVFNFIERVMQLVYQDLNQMVIAGKAMPYALVRQFVVNFYAMEMVDMMLYSAMKAPQDDLYY